jgi:20S proteasome alpha/beta subunit
LYFLFLWVTFFFFLLLPPCVHEQPIGVEALTQSVCDLALGFGEGKKDGEKSSQKMSRPFGVSLLMAGFDRREGPQLFFSDPSGTYPSVRKTQQDLL